MTSTNDGKDVKSNQTSGPKGKTYFIELYKSLEARLSEGGDPSERTKHLCEAWRRVHCLCQHSAPPTHTHLLAWLQRHTARAVLQTEWQTPKRKDDRKNLEEAIDGFITECEDAKASRDGKSTLWETQLVARGEWFKRVLERPWDHPVLTLLLNPNGTPPTDDEVLKWLKEERGVTFVMRLHTLVGEKCDDIAVALTTAVMERVRAAMPPVLDVDEPTDQPPPEKAEPTFGDRLGDEAGFTGDVWELLTDIEFVLLHKRDSKRCIALAKQTPLLNAYHLIERLQKRLEVSPREKRLWKNAKEVAILIAQVVIARCMVVRSCRGAVRTALYCCARLLARLLAARLPPAADALATQAPTARHLHTLAQAVDNQLSPTNENMKPYVCELYVRAITAGMNELERLKLKTEKEAEARSMEKTLGSWFVQLGDVLSQSKRIQCECVLTAFSLHPSQRMYERLNVAPQPVPVADSVEIKEDTVKSEFGSWANDSRSQTNFVKTSETLKMKHTQNQANVMSTAIFNEGEALGLSPELCQDIAVLLSGPRVKTLSWDMNRTLLMDNCRVYMERTHGGTRVLTRELKYLNIDPNQYQHLPEERDDDENDPYYGIERGYEHLAVPEYPDEIWEDAYERTETASSSGCEDEYVAPRRKKKTKRVPVTSDEDSDPLSFVAEAKRVHNKKERPHSKERSNEKAKKKQESVDPLDIDVHNQDQKKDKPKEKKERKKKEKSSKVKPQKSLASLVGLKVSKTKKKPIKLATTIIAPTTTDSDYDSQGKNSLASLNSEGHEHDVHHDTLFSTGELKSPVQKNPQSEENVGLTKKKESLVASGKSGIKISPSHTYRMPNNHSKMIYRPLTPNIVRQHSPCDHARNTTANNFKNYPDDVRTSISKLLEFRRHKAATELKNKPEIRPRTPQRKQAILRPDIPIQTNISPKAVTIPDIPKSYIKNQHAVKLAELKREVDNLLAHRKKMNTKSSVIQFAKKIDINKTFEPRRVPQHSNTNSLKMTDFVNVPYDRLMAEISERQDRNRYETVKPPHTANQPGLSNMPLQRSLNRITPGQQDYQSFLKEYEHIKYGTTGYAIDMSSKNSRDLKKDVRPTNRVTPVIPCSTIKAEPRTPIFAKQSQPKKLENSLNTFSRLSYMHKNKQTEIKNKNSPDKPVYSSTTYEEVSSELDQIIKEHQHAQMKVIQAKNESFDRLLKKTPNRNSQELNKNYGTSTQSLEHPLLSNLLQNPAISITSKSQNESQMKNSQKLQKSVTPQKSSLSEKDQNDLIHLLRQQNKLNTQYSTNTTSIPSTSKSSNEMSNNTSCMTDHNTMSSQKEHHFIKPPGHVNSYQSSFETKIISIVSNSLIKSSKPSVNAEKCVSAKSKSVVSTVENRIKSSDPQEKTKKTATSKSHPKKYLVNQIPESEKPEWQAVISDLLKHKTRSRGPNALDITLNKTSFEKAFEKSLEEPTIFAPRKSKREIGLESTKQQEKKYPPTPITTPLHNVISTDNGVKTQAYIPDQQKSSSDSIKNSNLIKSNPFNEKSIKQISEVVKKVPQEVQRKQFTYAGPKHDDPFISGIPNSDYDLLEELMDDDLRKEIGELSSDEESYNAAAQSFMKPTKNNEKRVCVEYNKPLDDMVAKKPETDMRCLNACRSSNKILHSVTQKPVIKCVNKTTLCANSIKVSQKAAVIKKTQDDNSLIMTTKNISAPMPTTTNTQSHAYKTLQTLHNNQVDSNIYGSAMPQQAPLQNIVLIGSELVYKGYSTIQTPVQGVSNLAASTYVAINNDPNTTLYQTTQFAAPVVQSVIIGGSITVPIISNVVACASIPIKRSAIINVTKPAYSVELPTPVPGPHMGMETCDINVEINNHGSIIHGPLKNEKQQDVNKTIERKVLSEVQELVVNENIEKMQNQKVENDMDVKKDADQERLKMKRLAIINREIYHHCGDKPIPLSYSPLSLKTQPDSKQHNCSPTDYFTYTPQHSNQDKQTVSDCEDEKLLITQIKNNLQDLSNAINEIESPAMPDNNESKENKIIHPTVKCRRILLRSSNKITSKSNIERVVSENTSVKKSKVKLKSDTTDAGSLADEKSSQNSEDKEAITQKRASKRLLNKTLTITKEEKTPFKNDRLKPCPKAKLLLKDEASKLREKTVELVSNNVIIDGTLFDMETELLGSKISRKLSEYKTVLDEDSNVPTDDHMSMEKPDKQTKDIMVSKNSIPEETEKNPDSVKSNLSKNVSERKEGQDNRSDVFTDDLVNKKVSTICGVKDFTTSVSISEKMKVVSEHFRSIIMKTALSTDHNTVNKEIPADREVKNNIVAAVSVPEKTNIPEHFESKISKIDFGFKSLDEHLNLSTDQQSEKEGYTLKEDENIVYSKVSVTEKADNSQGHITNKNISDVIDDNINSINEQIVEKIDTTNTGNISVHTKSTNIKKVAANSINELIVEKIDTTNEKTGKISVDTKGADVKKVAEKISCELSTNKLIEILPTPNKDKLKFAMNAKDKYFNHSFTERASEDLGMKDTIEQTTDKNESETTTSITAGSDDQNKDNLTLKDNIDLDMSVTCEDVNVSKTTSGFACIKSARNKTINDKFTNNATVRNRSKETETHAPPSSVIPTIDMTMLDAEYSDGTHAKTSTETKITNKFTQIGSNQQERSGTQPERYAKTSTETKITNKLTQIGCNLQERSRTQSELSLITSFMAKTDDDVVIIDDAPNTTSEATITNHATDAKQSESNKDMVSHPIHINELSDIPQSYKDSIQIDNLPSENPLKKCVRVRLPNGRKFKATVYGEVHVNLDTLFTYPSIKSALLNRLDSKKLLTMNIKQITTVAKSDPKKILSAQIQDIQTSTEPVETIDLLSEDEDTSPSQVIQKADTQSFETEYGKFRILPIDKDIFTKHQSKFRQKPLLLLKKVDSKPVEVPKNIHVKMNNVNQNTIIAAIPGKYVTGVINDIEYKLISESKNTSANVTDIVEIDDSSNDSINFGKSNLYKSIQPDDKLNELKNVLLKELGVKEQSPTTANILQTNGNKNHKTNVVNEINSTKGIRLRSRGSKLTVIPAGQSCPFNSLDKEEQLKITSRKCYVKLVRCDSLNKKYEEKDQELIINLVDNTSDDDSFTIIEDYSILNDLDTNTVESATRSSSPVIELNNVLACLDNNSVIQSESAVHQEVLLSCEADWFTDKATLHLRDVNNAKPVWTDIYNLQNNNVTDFESSLPCMVNEKTTEEVSLQRNCVRSLTSLVLELFENPNIINRYSQFCPVTTRSRVNILKRKSSSVKPFAAFKVSRLDLKVVKPKLIDRSVSSTLMLDCSDAANISVFNLEDTRMASAGDKLVDTTNCLNETDIENIVTVPVSISDTKDSNTASELEIGPGDQYFDTMKTPNTTNSEIIGKANFSVSNFKDIKITSHLEISPDDKSIFTMKEINSENMVMENVSVSKLEDTKLISVLDIRLDELVGDKSVDTTNSLNDFENIVTKNVSASDTEDTKTIPGLEISLDVESFVTTKNLNETDNNDIGIVNVPVANIEDIAMISVSEINPDDKSTASKSLNEISIEHMDTENVSVSNVKDTEMCSDHELSPSDTIVHTTNNLNEIHFESMAMANVSVSNVEDIKISNQNTDHESSPDYECVDTTQSIKEINIENMVMENFSVSTLKDIEMTSDHKLSSGSKPINSTKTVRETNFANIFMANVSVFNLEDTMMHYDHELSPDDKAIDTRKSLNETDVENYNVIANDSVTLTEDTKTSSDLELNPDEKSIATTKSPNNTNSEYMDEEYYSDSILDIKEIVPLATKANDDMKTLNDAGFENIIIADVSFTEDTTTTADFEWNQNDKSRDTTKSPNTSNSENYDEDDSYSILDIKQIVPVATKTNDDTKSLNETDFENIVMTNTYDSLTEDTKTNSDLELSPDDKYIYTTKSPNKTNNENFDDDNDSNSILDIKEIVPVATKTNDVKKSLNETDFENIVMENVSVSLTEDTKTTSKLELSPDDKSIESPNKTNSEHFDEDYDSDSIFDIKEMVPIATKINDDKKSLNETDFENIVVANVSVSLTEDTKTISDLELSPDDKSIDTTKSLSKTNRENLDEDNDSHSINDIKEIVPVATKTHDDNIFEVARPESDPTMLCDDNHNLNVTFEEDQLLKPDYSESQINAKGNTINNDFAPHSIVTKESVNNTNDVNEARSANEDCLISQKSETTSTESDKTYINNKLRRSPSPLIDIRVRADNKTMGRDSIQSLENECVTENKHDCRTLSLTGDVLNNDFGSNIISPSLDMLKTHEEQVNKKDIGSTIETCAKLQVKDSACNSLINDSTDPSTLVTYGNIQSQMMKGNVNKVVDVCDDIEIRLAEIVGESLINANNKKQSELFYKESDKNREAEILKPGSNENETASKIEVILDEKSVVQNNAKEIKFIVSHVEQTVCNDQYQDSDILLEETASDKYNTITDHEYTTLFSTTTSKHIEDMSEKVEVFYISTHDGIFLSEDELTTVLEEEIIEMRSDEIIDDISFGNSGTKTDGSQTCNLTLDDKLSINEAYTCGQDDDETENLEVNLLKTEIKHVRSTVNSVESVKNVTTKEDIMYTSKIVNAKIDISKHLTLFGNKSEVLEDNLRYEDSQKMIESNVISNTNIEIGKIKDKITFSSIEVTKKPNVSENCDDIEARLAKMFDEPTMYVETEEQIQKYSSYKGFDNQNLGVKSNDDEFTNKSKGNLSDDKDSVILSIEKTQDMNDDSFTENFNVMLPKQTYARDIECNREPRKNLKRKLDMSDVNTKKQKYRKGKNIDYPKFTAAAICDTAYAKEYKRLLDYCSSVKFSYAIPFHREEIDVQEALASWPIKNKHSDTADRSIEVNETLFTDTEKCKAITDPLEQTLPEEITSEYNENSYEPSNIDETNFNMGFGEMSDRVIQESKDGEFTTFSAATLSDVKQLQPLLPSDKQGVLVKPNGISNEQQDQRLKTMRFVDNLNLKEKVRSFFMKTKSELTMDCVLTKKQDEFENPIANANWPFGLVSPSFIRPSPAEVTVNVVQVGQLPVTTAAQNAVTCDPRVTHVSNVSPSQCSPENNSSDELQTTIKTEYTELTTADITLPLMQEYAQHHHSIPNESQETTNFCANDTITVSTEIKSVVKIELMEETSQENMDEDVGYENNELHSISNGNMATTGPQFQFENVANNRTSEPATNIQPVATSSSKKMKISAPFSQDKQHSNSLDHSDQFAHGMNAVDITVKYRMTKPNNTAFTNTTSQNERFESQPNVVTTSQSNTNNYTKSTPISAVALQQALAHILPPLPPNQANTSENNPQTTANPQVLHVVHGNNAPSVINKPNGTQLLHIIQNKSTTTNGTSASQSNNFSGLSVIDGDIQQNGNQVLQIVNTGNQKNSNAGQLLKRVNLLTNLANVQGSHEQKMVQFVCKSADGKSIQLPQQRSMVLRVQHLDPANVPTISTQNEPQDLSPSSSTTHSVSDKEPTPQEIKSRSLYEENYAKFVQNGDPKPGQEKATSLPKFNQVFGKIYQDKQNEIDNENLPENSECAPDAHDLPLDQITDIGSPPMLTRKPQTETSQPQPTLVQQIKQTISPMNIQTMHGGVIYTRQIPVNLGNGQTINLITVPSTEMVDDSVQKPPMESKFENQEGETPIIKIVPSQPATTPNAPTEDNNVHMRSTNENNLQPNPQPVLTQMRIKLPMLSKAPQMVGGTRVVRPSFFQIQRNVIGGANQQVYQQLVLTTAPPLGQSIRVPAQTQRHKTPSETQSSPESQMSSSTLEQLREFDMVLEQVKERSTVQPGSSTSTNNKFPKLTKPSADTTDAPTPSTSNKESPSPVLYSIGNTQPLNMVNFVNRKSAITSTTTSSYVRSPDSTAIIESPTSSTHANLPLTTTSDSCASSCASEAAAATTVARPKKKKPKPSSSSSNPFNIKNTPKPSSQKPLEDEQTTQRILYILAEYKEQVENSPDKDKPAPRRRNNPAAPNAGSSKRKKSSSGSRKRDMSPVVGEDSCRTMGSEDSSCGTSLGECNECLESHSPEEESPRKVVRRLTFEQETHITTQTRTIPQRNVIVTDGQAFAVRGATGKPATTVLMPANYLLPVSMVKGGQQIAIMTNRGPKLLVGAGEGGAGGTLLLQRLIGPGGLKPVLTRPGVRHIRLPTSALHNLQAFNIATPATTAQPPDSTASPAPAPTPPDLVDTRAMSSPWPDRDAGDGKPDGGSSSPDGSEPWNLPSSSIADDYGYEEIVRTDNMDRTVLDAIPDRYSPDMEAQRIFDKMFDVDSKKSMYDTRCGYDIDASDDDKAYHQVVQRKDGRQTRLTHVSAAALRHKYAILEHELHLQKSLSEECEDLGVDSPSASDLFPEAELLFAPSPAYEQTIDQCHTPQPSLSQGIPQPDLDDQIATDQLLTHRDRNDELDLNLDDVGEIVTVGEDGMTTIPLDHEEFARSHAEFARSHPNTTFHSEPEDGEIPPFTIAQAVKGRQIAFPARVVPGTVVMAPQTTVISQATVEAAGSHNTVKFADIDNMINAMPSPQHPHVNNIPSVLVKENNEGLTKFDRLLNESRQMSSAASAIVHSTGNGTQVIRRVHYETRRDTRYTIDDHDSMMAGEARMTDRREMSIGDNDTSSSERHSDLFWEANTPSRPERRRFEFDSDKCCKNPYDEANSDSSGIGAHTRLDSVIKAARSERRRSDGSSTDDSHPPLRTYPAKRPHQHNMHVSHHHSEMDRTAGKSRVSDRCHDVKDESRRRASNRGVVKRGCHCCNGSTAPPKTKKSRPKKSVDFPTHS